jgi:tRNA(Arg) A34 adenosine deaminase TadA
MCAGAVFWSNIRRVVFGCRERKLYEMISDGNEDVLRLPCRELFARGARQIEVVGPVLESEALKVHAGFWS